MYVCWTPDVTPDLIGHLTLVLTDSTHQYIDYDGHLIPDCVFDLTHTILCAIHITVYLLYSCYFVILVYIFSLSAHMLYAHALSSLFLYIH